MQIIAAKLSREGAPTQSIHSEYIKWTGSDMRFCTQSALCSMFINLFRHIHL